MTRQYKNTYFDYEKYMTTPNAQGFRGNRLNGSKITNDFTNRNNDKINETPDAVYRLVFSNFGVDEFKEPTNVEQENKQKYLEDLIYIEEQFKLTKQEIADQNKNYLQNFKKKAVDKFGRSTLANNINAEIYIPYRQAQIQLLNNTRLKVSIAGDPAITVGYTVYIEIPSKHPIPGQKSIDPYYSGKYLVTALKHIVSNKKEFKTVLELSKDSTMQPYGNVTKELPGWKDAVDGKLTRIFDWDL